LSDKKIYTFLAGPDCFYPDFDEVRTKKQELCRQYGLEPLPNDEFPDILPENPTDYDICWMNIKRLDRCELVLANLCHFRGSEPDAGTVWDAGYAYAKGKKVYAYYDYPDMLTAVEKEYSPITWVEEERGGKTVKIPKDKDGANVENFGKMLNLMMTGTFPCIHGTLEDVLEVVAKDLGLTKKD
jgi:nucleoside 2-deoxyribosyltransferase